MDDQAFECEVETELHRWKKREAHFSHLFSLSPAMEKVILIEKLKWYDRTAMKFRGTKDMNERFALNLLKQERRQIARQLYPNPVFRVLQRLFWIPAKQRIQITGEGKAIDESCQRLNDQTRQLGFPDLSLSIRQLVSQGYPRFKLHTSSYLNKDERLDYELSVVKNHSGIYELRGYKASLYSEDQPGGKKEYYFSLSSGHEFNSRQAYNLLSGRSVQQQGVWRQLDFTDKHPDGSYRMKAFHPGYGFDLEKNVKLLLGRGGVDNEETKKLLEDLKNGEQVAVVLRKNGMEKYLFIEANPQFTALNIYNETHNKISLRSAIGNSLPKPTKLSTSEKQRHELYEVPKKEIRIR
ncbi:MAG TPA: hypothetical protein PLS00_00105 [Niabella sp.]|nr:hypothetical protein [Niabella sp.]HUN01226.1 hypothetical protein [Niabella sp.]